MDIRELNHQWWDEFDEKRMVVTINVGEDDTPIEIPVYYEVCHVCGGKGKHVNPSIDSQGLSAEDFDNDPDFRENYFSGMYDVNCSCCHGNRVEPEPNYDNMDAELVKAVQERIDDFYNCQRDDWNARERGY